MVALNHAVAVAMAQGPELGLELLEEPELAEKLSEYLPYYAAIADLNRRNGKYVEAKAAYEQALERANNLAEDKYFRKRLAEISGF